MPSEPTPVPPAAGGPSGDKLRAAWEKVRVSFKSSIMVNTAMNSLAQNLDLDEWPISGADETPAKYIPLGYDALVARPEFAGHPARVELLVDILRETLAFDEPFGEMVVEAPGSAERENPILKNMERLGIPGDFPLSLVAVLPETREYCTKEKLVTLRDFALSAQKLSETMVVSGDFRSFLNALSHIDEEALAGFLPFRPGSKGLHLLEGLALSVRAQSDAVQAALAQRYGARLGTEDLALAAQASALEAAAVEQLLAHHAAAYADFFKDDLAKLQKLVDDGVPIGRVAAALKSPLVETVVVGMVKPYLTLPSAHAPTRTSAPPVDDDLPSRKKGFFASLARWFKK